MKASSAGGVAGSSRKAGLFAASDEAAPVAAVGALGVGDQSFQAAEVGGVEEVE